MAIENLNWTSFHFGISRFATICRANSLILSLCSLLGRASPARVLAQKKEALQSMNLTCEHQHFPELYKLEEGKKANKGKTILDLTNTAILPRGCGSRSVDH